MNRSTIRNLVFLVTIAAVYAVHSGRVPGLIAWVEQSPIARNLTAAGTTATGGSQAGATVAAQVNGGSSVQEGPATAIAGGSNLFLGNPSGATTDPANANNYLMVKDYFTLSYNNSKGDPNWVSWCLVASDIGDAPRADTFATDDNLPVNIIHITQEDFNRTGFDRGHMCPKEDRSATTTMSYATFVMTNVIPQAPDVNRQRWEKLEEYERKLAKQGNRVYILDGPTGVGGSGTAGAAQSIVHGEVTVPGYCWKVIVAVPDEGRDDGAEFNANTRVITVIMPNQNTPGEDWTPYRNYAPADVEKATGLRFFTSLPPAVASALESKVDQVPVR
jgi:endonuclease G